MTIQMPPRNKQRTTVIERVLRQHGTNWERRAYIDRTHIHVTCRCGYVAMHETFDHDGANVEFIEHVAAAIEDAISVVDG